MTAQKIQRFCIKDGAQMHLASGASYDGIAECPRCGRREALDCGGSRVISARVPAPVAMAVKQAARRKSVTTNAIIETAVTEYLDLRTAGERFQDEESAMTTQYAADMRSELY